MNDKWIQTAKNAENFMAGLELVLLAVVGRLATWLAPLPSALLVGRALGDIFELAGAWPWVMAGTVELVGLVTSGLWLTAKEWNENKRKTDPAANERLALGALIFYFVVVVAILAVLELPVMLETGNPSGLVALLFPGLSVVAILAMNERAAQTKRQAAIAQEKQERKAARQARRVSKPPVSKTSVKDVSKTVKGTQPVRQPSAQAEHVQDVQNADLDALNVQRQAEKAEMLDRMLDIYLDSPRLGATEMSKRLGVSRASVYNYLGELEAAGRVKKNGSGVEVLT